MALTSVAAKLRTNVHSKSIHKGFLAKFAEFLAKTFNTDIQHVVVELQCEVQMLREGSDAPMLNMDILHNSDVVTQQNKHQVAGNIASHIAASIRLPESRVLVLFFDTRVCN